MALISCPECKKEISDKASVCIHCGYDIQEHFNEIKEKQKEAEKALQRLEELIRMRDQADIDFENRLNGCDNGNHRRYVRDQADIDFENRLNEIELPNSPPKFNGKLGFGILLIIFAVSMIVWMICLEVNTPSYYPDEDRPIIPFVIIGLVGWVITCAGWGELKRSKELYNKYSNNEYEYRRQLLIDKINDEDWEKAIKANMQHSKNIKNQISTDSNGNIICPKCGSTQIQLVNRKYSLVTGILTNKVDRVCLKCKNKF